MKSFRNRSYLHWSIFCVLFIALLNPVLSTNEDISESGKSLPQEKTFEICLPAFLCLSNHCANGATCIVSNDNCAICICPEGTNGYRCEDDYRIKDNIDSQTNMSVSHLTSYNDYTDRTKGRCVSRNSTDGECPVGFPCVNGRCVWTPYNDSHDPQAMEIHCECEGHWIGDDCSTCCDLQCEDNEQCVSIEGGKKMCQPNEWLPITQASVSDVKIQPSVTLIVTIVVLVLATSGAAIALLSYIWRKKANFLFSITNNLGLQGEEKSDCKFDAFVSYKASAEDEDFVMHQLYPKLEKQMGYKLCMHCRDFLGGVPIVENIIWAVQNSRRTLLILSPDFVASEWTRFEYQVAQREMLRAKHRIIPIILREFDRKDIDQHLDIILSSVTYLEWSQDEEKQKKFWLRLAKALPKRKVATQHSDRPSGSPCVSKTIPSNPSDSCSGPWKV